MRRNKATRSSSSYPASYVNPAKNDYKSISQLEAERSRRDVFITGSNGAAALMCLMFLVLTIGAVMFGW